MMPQTRSLTGVDITQLGLAVLQCLNAPDKYNEQCIPLAGENSPPQVYIDAISEKLGKRVELKLVPIDTYARLKTPGSEEMARMFAWFDEFGYFGSRDWTLGKKVVSDLKPFRTWMDENIKCLYLSLEIFIRINNEKQFETLPN